MRFPIAGNRCLRLIMCGAVALSLLPGCGGGGGSDNPPFKETASSPTATLIGAYDPQGVPVASGQSPQAPGVLQTPTGPTLLFDYSPVGVHFTWTPSAIPASEIVEYHVYRSDFTAAPVQVSDGGTAPGILPVMTQVTQGPLDLWDDGTDKPISFVTLDTVKGTTVSVKSQGGVVVGTGIHNSAVGERLMYSVEALWKDRNGFHLTKKFAANSVTYLQPANLDYTSSFTGVSADRIFLTLGATRGADDYVLELSESATFGTKKIFKPYNTGLIQISAASQTDPRNGPSFPYFDPATGIDMIRAFPSALAVYARVGVRDSRNGTNVTVNPYLYSRTVVAPHILKP